MPFDIGKFINDISDYVIEESIFSSLIKSPIGTAMILSVCILILLFFAYGSIFDTNTEIFKTFLYLTAISTGVLFIHYSAVKYSFENTDVYKKQKELFTDCTTCDNKVPINAFETSTANVAPVAFATAATAATAAAVPYTPKFGGPNGELILP